MVYALNKFKDVSIEIGGHTDNVGNPKSNLSLSASRAESVNKYLIDAGISSSRLQNIGYGDKMPIASNDTEEGRQKNRRTELNIIH